MIEELKRKAMAEREARAEDKFTTAWHDAASPDIVLRLVAAVEAAKIAESGLTRAVLALAHVISTKQVHAYGADYEAVDKALRTARAALADLEGKQ